MAENHGSGHEISTAHGRIGWFRRRVALFLKSPETGIHSPRSACWGSTEKTLAKQDDKFTMDAIVLEALPNAMFKLRLPNEQQSEIIGYVSGKMRKHYIRILPGDTVTVEISPYDLTRARITYRR